MLPDVSESLPNGASEFWFNYVFAWWFTGKLHPSNMTTRVRVKRIWYFPTTTKRKISAPQS